MVELRSEHGPPLVLTADHLVLTTRRVTQLTPDGGWSGVPPTHVDRARQLRKEGSPPERILWDKLRGQQLGVKFRRQHQLGPYIADFYSRDAGLVVEVDGETHFTAEATEYDRRRDAWMTNLGLTVRRFTASEVGANLDGVLEAIWDESRQQVLRDDPKRQWLRADRLRAGDTMFVGVDQGPTPLTSVERWDADETVFDLEVEDAHSFVTEAGTVHNCGSGTTAYVAEQWGRRWITIDTSRVALALARTRQMAARFPYYLLADSPAGRKKRVELGMDPTPALPASGEGESIDTTSGEGESAFPPLPGGSRGSARQTCTVGSSTVPHVTLKTIANNPDIQEGMTRE
jgi:very-short-patch-repair endonuclease